MKKGKLIVIEGACDGIGKTTQYNLLKERLIKDGYEVYSHHFPTYNEVQGQLVKEYLSGNLGSINKDDAYFIASLYAVDRAVTYNTSLKKQFNDNKIVLLDRYTTSTLIYQSANIEDKDKKIEFINYIMDLEYKKIGIKKPDQVIFLTAPFDLVTKLRKDRTHNEGIKNDIHESNIKFMKKVYDNANYVANLLSWDIIECSSNDEFKDIETIHNEIYDRILKNEGSLNE